jgi:hypothetical protein
VSTVGVALQTAGQVWADISLAHCTTRRQTDSSRTDIFSTAFDVVSANSIRSATASNTAEVYFWLSDSTRNSQGHSTTSPLIQALHCQTMDRLNTTFRNHLNISDTIASSITGLSISKIKMISGLTPLEGINLRSLLPDSIQPLVLLSYPASMATSCAAAEGCGIDRIASSRGSAVGYWGTIERKLEGSLSFLEPLSARQAALQKTVVELTENTPLLRKILRPTWLRQAISSSTSPPGTSTTNFPSRVYGKGPKDALFVLFWAVAFTVLRELTMRYILQPLMRQRLEQLDARRRKKATNGKSLKEETGGDEMTASRRRECRLREKTVTRFAEQGWTFTYASTFFTLGVVSCSGLQRRRRLLIALPRSTCCYRRTNGLSHQPTCGKAIPILHLPNYRNSTISLNSVSGFINFSLSTSKRGGRITGKCTHITSSLSLSLPSVIGQTTLGSEVSLWC